MIARKIKELREGMGISQPQLAKGINVANSSISFWENGVNEPKASYVFALANFFEVSADYLLGVGEQPQHIVIEQKFSPEIENILELCKLLDKLQLHRLTAYGQGMIDNKNK